MKTNLAQTVPAQIRGELAKRNIKRAAFAHDLGVSTYWLSRRLSGAVEMTLDDLDRIAERLQLDPVDVLGGAGGPTK